MRPPAHVLAACVLSLACHPAATATPLDLSQIVGPGLIFDDVHVFDRVGDLGVVEGQRITHVGPVALDTLPPASNLVMISGGRKLTLLPGLIDAHAHVSGPPDLASALNYGVTTVLDQFMHEQTMGRIERQQANGRLLDHSAAAAPIFVAGSRPVSIGSRSSTTMVGRSGSHTAPSMAPRTRR